MPRDCLVVCGALIFSVVAGCSADVPPVQAPGKATAPQVASDKTAPVETPPAQVAVAPAGNAAPDADVSALPKELLALFRQLDELGRDRVKDARFVTVTLRYPGANQDFSENAWLITEDDTDVTLLKGDLIPWIYRKKGLTQTSGESKIQLKSVNDADFEAFCKTMGEAEKEPQDEEEQIRRRMKAMHGPGPSHRLLVAHAAWKKGLARYPEQIVAVDPVFAEDKGKYNQSVMDDLGWLHFLRGVNLLTFADRKEVLPHLRLAAKLAPQFKFGTDVNDLITRVEELVADSEKQKPPEISETGLSTTEKAELYVSQLKDLNCVQMSQPGNIMPYGMSDGIFGKSLASKKLKDLGMAAVPVLIKALEDETPTRTVYHWRDFHHSRLVWRVSDFAWTILRDITQKDFGDQRVVGFTFSYLDPQQKQAVIADIRKWHAESKDLSPDERMLGFFSSAKPDDWIKAGQYFLKKKDKRAVAPLIEKIAGAENFNRGDLCELVARFGDPQAIPAIAEVLKSASEASDRLHAAMALWNLGDGSGVPVAIEFVTAEKQPYGSWDDPVWFLMRSHTPEGIEALKSVVLNGPVPRAGEVLGFIALGITGDLWGKTREPAACVEICPLLIAAMERNELTGATVNDVKIRFKDSAAKSFATMRHGWDPRFGGRHVQIDPRLFNELEPDESRRDEQIEALKKWYEENKDRLTWNAKTRKLVVKPAE